MSIQRNVILANAMTGIAPAVAHQHAEVAYQEKAEPPKPDPFADDGQGGNRAERRKRKFEGHRWGGHATNKHPPTKVAKKAKHRREKAGRKAARKGK